MGRTPSLLSHLAGAVWKHIYQEEEKLMILAFVALCEEALYSPQPWNQSTNTIKIQSGDPMNYWSYLTEMGEEWLSEEEMIEKQLSHW